MENRMQIGNVSASMISSVVPKTPEAVEAPGPNHDGDGDDASSATRSATAPGVGKAVDMKA